MVEVTINKTYNLCFGWQCRQFPRQSYDALLISGRQTVLIERAIGQCHSFNFVESTWLPRATKCM